MNQATGATIGVEEEYHLVDAADLSLADAPAVVPEAIGLLGEHAQGEISTSQLEVSTPVCSSLTEVREQLRRLRAGADTAAQRHGCRILAAGTHPTGTWHDQQMTPGPRYAEIAERLGLLAYQQLIAGTHVHVAVPDPELAVQVLDRLRPDLPVLLALSGSSPFWEGVDTGYASYRTQWFARFPVVGTPLLLGSRKDYDLLVAGLVRSGVVEDASHLYWDARPSTRWPTVEVRIADTCPRLDDVVLQAGLARSLVRVAVAGAQAETPFEQPRPELVRAARWRAARDGLEGSLFDLRTLELRPVQDVVLDLLRRLRDDLESTGDWAEVSALTAQALSRGTSAREQRVCAERSGIDAVSQLLVDQLLVD